MVHSAGMGPATVRCCDLNEWSMRAEFGPFTRDRHATNQRCHKDGPEFDEIIDFAIIAQVCLFMTANLARGIAFPDLHGINLCVTPLELE